VEGEKAAICSSVGLKSTIDLQGLIRQSLLSTKKNVLKIVFWVKKTCKVYILNLNGPVPIPAKKTLIYVKKPGSASEWLNFHT
jgi:ribosomal protein S10